MDSTVSPIDQIYTTEELSEILKQELMACVKGQRTFPMPDNAEEIASQYPLGSFIGAQRLFQIGCYHEFRDQVQKYQLEHNVSGLVIKKHTIVDREYRFPEPEDQLNLTPDDYDVLKLSKPAIVEAFLSFDDGFTYLSFGHEDKAGCDFQVETTANYVRHFAESCDWAELSQRSEYCVTLRLGYGDYIESAFVASVSELAKYSDSVYFTFAKACKNYLRTN
jgi:hypothetical protein